MALVSLAVFDVGGPLAVYYGLRSEGVSAVVALVVSGLLPAVGIGLGVRRHRRIDAVGVVVLAGILVGAVLGLVSGSARLVLIDGLAGTAVLGGACFGSLLTGRPLMFRVALQFNGPDSPAGREFEDKWQYPEFRRFFALITVAWGAAFLAETAAQAAVVESASIGTAKTTSNLMPIAVAGLMIVLTGLYGRRQRTQGVRAATVPDHVGTTSPAMALSIDPSANPGQ